MQQHTYAQRAHNTHSPARLPVPVGRHPGLLPFGNSAFGTTQHNTTQRNATQRNATQRNATQRNATQRNATQRNTAQHNTTQHNTTQHNTTQHNTTQHNTTQHNTTQHNTTQHNTTQHNTTQHNTTQHNTTQHNTTQHNTIQYNTTTQHNVTQRNNTTHDRTRHQTTQHTHRHPRRLMQIKREELFIQCKLYNANHRKDHVKPDLMASLEDLQLDYVDSFVIHWPQACPSTGEAPAYNKHGAHPGALVTYCPAFLNCPVKASTRIMIFNRIQGGRPNMTFVNDSSRGKLIIPFLCFHRLHQIILDSYTHTIVFRTWLRPQHQPQCVHSVNVATFL